MNELKVKLLDTSRTVDLMDEYDGIGEKNQIVYERLIIYNENLLGYTDLKKAFNYFDFNGDGFLNKEDIEKSLMRDGVKRTFGVAGDIVKDVLANDTKIDYEKFKTFFIELPHQPTLNEE